MKKEKTFWVFYSENMANFEAFCKTFSSSTKHEIVGCELGDSLSKSIIQNWFSDALADIFDKKLRDQQQISKKKYLFIFQNIP